MLSVLRENGRGWEAVFGAGSEKVFLPGDLHGGPTSRADTDDPSGANAFDNQAGLEPDLDAAAAEGDFSVRPEDVEDFATGSDVPGAIVTGSVLQGVLGSVDLCRDVFPEVVVEGRIHASEQRRSDSGTAKLAILHGIDPGRHPAAADKHLVFLVLKPGGMLDGVVIQPDIR
ncbi:MAG: hypothetical protein VW879_16065, partial [Opitutae bacterium]